MGTSRSWAELDRKLERLVSEITAMPKEVVPAEATIAQKSVQISLPSSLRGVRRGRSKIEVHRLDTGGPGEASSRVFPSGPAHLIEHDTRAHLIPGPVVIPGASTSGAHGPRGVRASVKSPGAKGQHRWEKGIEAALPVMRRYFAARGSTVFTKVF